MVLRPSRLLLAALVLCAACIGPATIASPVPPTATTAPAASATPAPTLTLPAPPTSTLPPTATIGPQVDRVLIVTVDGLRADALYRVNMPVLADLMQHGASALNAQTIVPSATLPAHASILSASCPSKHSVTWNDYSPEQGEPRAVTLFDLVHAVGGRTVMVVGKEKLIQAVHRQAVDVFAYVAGHDRDLAARAVNEMEAGFDAMFVHLPVVDGVGHTYGWMSREQVSVIERADAAVGTLLAALEQRGWLAGTLVIVTADHGGHLFTHGSDQPEDMTVPWIVAGPGVIPSLRLEAPVSVMDAAATAAWALGLDSPLEWDGRVVEEAFGIPVDFDSLLAPNALCGQ